MRTKLIVFMAVLALALVGSTGRAEDLVVNGNGTFNAPAGTNLYLTLNRDAANHYGSLVFATAGVWKWTLGSADSDFIGIGDDFYIGQTVGGASAAITILANNNVGIGTTNPQAKLDVVGDIKANDVTAKGPWVDVRAYASFSAAIDDIGMNHKTLLIPNTQIVDANKTVPPNVDLLFLQGGSLSINTGVTVTLQGTVTSDKEWPFTGGGTVVWTPSSSLMRYSSGIRLRASENAENVFDTLERGLSFVALDSAGNPTPYAGITGRIDSNTDMNEMGELWFYTNDNGGFYPMARFAKDGEFIIAPGSGPNSPHLPGGVRAAITAGDNNDEELLELGNIMSSAIGRRSYLVFTALDSSGAPNRFGGIYAEVVNNTAGAEAGSLNFLVQRNGASFLEIGAVLNKDRQLYAHRAMVEAHTVNYAVTQEFDSNKNFTNEGATGAITFTLPQIVTGVSNIGLEYTFTVVESGKSIYIDPYSTDRICPTTNNNGDRLTNSGTRGASVTLRAVAGGVWAEVAKTGSWLDAN